MILLVFIIIAAACVWGFHRLTVTGRTKIVNTGFAVESGLCLLWAAIWMLTSGATSLGAAYAMLFQAGYLCASVIGHLLARRQIWVPAQ